MTKRKGVPKVKHNVIPRIVSTLFFLVALAVLALIVLVGLQGSIQIPERLLQIHALLDRIFFQGFYGLPVYLLFCAFLFLFIDSEHRFGVLFPFTLIPLITFLAFFHLYRGTPDDPLVLLISPLLPVRSAALIVLFVFVLEVVLFILWSSTHFSSTERSRSENFASGEKRPGKEAQVSGAPARLGDDADHLSVHDLSLVFPKLPELPELKTLKGRHSWQEEAEERPETLSLDDASWLSAEHEEQQERVVSAPAVERSVTPRVQQEPQRDSKPLYGRLHSITEEDIDQSELKKEPEAPILEEDQNTQPDQGPETPPERIRIGEHEITRLPDEDPSFVNLKDTDLSGNLRRINELPDEQDDPRPLERAPRSDLGSGSSFRDRLGYTYPPEDILDTYPDISSDIDEVTRLSGEILMKTLREFKIEAELTGIQKGPVVTMYEILPAPGIRVQAITNLADNIALQLAASRVRMVAPIPGKQAVGIEVPNKRRSVVSFKEMLSEVDRKSKYEIPVVLGKDITGESQVIDLVKTPHLLIAGATGSGKSVCVNSLICSILYRRSPQDVRLMMVDPKIVELKLYNDIPHLLTPVITESKKAIKALQYCIYEMERRYDLLDNLNVRDIKTYNRRIREQHLAREKLPYIVLVIDEFADLMTTTGKEMESYLARLAAMARAVGIHLVLATQRPSTNVITGIIKANIPSRIAFMVTSNTDSRIILDQAGAEKLLGRGDMLFSSSWDPNLIRLQGSFLSEEEVERIVHSVKLNGEPDYLDEEIFYDDEEDFEDEFSDDEGGEQDSLMEEALKIVYSRNGASASYLQRRLKIGYNRAARIVEQMEERGIVGPARGSLPREVLRVTDVD